MDTSLPSQPPTSRGSTRATRPALLGPDGRPARSRRAPLWADVPDEQWDDWRWQLSHRVNDLAEIEQVLRPDRRGARRAVRARQVPGGHHALLHQPHRPRRPGRPHPAPGHPARPGAAGVHGDDGGLARRGPPLAGARARPSLPRPGADAGHHPVRELLPVLHPLPDRGRPHPELQPQGPRGAAGVPAPDAPGAGRAHQRR